MLGSIAEPTSHPHYPNMDLLDINVWLALVDQNHQHHEAAAAFWQKTADTPIAFTRVSMLGFLRLSTQNRVLSRPLSNTEAWAIYQSYRALSRITFLAEPAGLEAHFQSLTSATDFPLRHWTDAYLAAHAIASDARLVSFDADFTRFPQLRFLHLRP